MDVRPDGLLLNRREMLDVIVDQAAYPELATHVLRQFEATLVPDRKEAVETMLGTALQAERRPARKYWKKLRDAVVENDPSDIAPLGDLYVYQVGGKLDSYDDPGEFNVPASLAPQLGKLYLSLAVDERENIQSRDTYLTQELPTKRERLEQAVLNPGWLARHFKSIREANERVLRGMSRDADQVLFSQEISTSAYQTYREQLAKVVSIVPAESRTELTAVALPEDPLLEAA